MLLPVVFLYSGCVIEGDEEISLTYHVTTGYGAAPVDSNVYNPGNTVTVMPIGDVNAPNNTIFYGWSTSDDGSGAFYKPNDTFTIHRDTTLYALWSGTGSTTYPTLFSTKAELETIAAVGNYALVADIGNINSVLLTSGAFTGKFDGRGHKVTVNITEPASNIGLFAAIGTNGEIKNLHVAGTIAVEDTGGNPLLSVGSIAGGSTGSFTIKNCRSTVNITVSSNADALYVGGLAGSALSGITVQYCYYSGQITSTYTGSADDYQHFVGGISTGVPSGTISNTVSEASITWTSSSVPYNSAKGGARQIMSRSSDISSGVSGSKRYTVLGVTATMTASSPVNQAANADYDGTAVNGASLGSEVWWRYTAEWSPVWGGDNPTVDKPWTWDVNAPAGAKRPKLFVFD